MNYRYYVPGMALLLLSGCASHHGVYAPDCIAFAGDTISLDGSEFAWERFTDQVKVSDDGKVIDPYPEYPKRGSYTLDGDTVRLRPESGESMDNFYLQRIDGTWRLLTAEQNSSWEQTGRHDQCILTLGSGDSI